MSSTSYRPEIDGLRAVAVMAVLMYHAGVPGFGGGYVGVDIFFVISGFLITGIICRPIADRGFSLLQFYERRARRILPALVAMFVFTTFGAILIMPPRLLSGYGADLIASALSFSNVRFWKSSGYFNGAAELNPLIHTWSLAVEEQFYLFYPLILALLYKWFARSIPALLAFGLLFSLGLSVWAADHAPMAGFYLIPTRAWELLAGGLLTYLPKQPWRTGWSNLISLAGAGIILVAITLFTDATPFPGWHAALPVAGTALLILTAAPGTLAGKLLTLRPVTFIGLISYSLYLVHQPIFALLRIYLVFELSWFQKAVTLAICIAVAYLSWRWIERPFRDGGSALKTQNSIFMASGGALLTTVLAGLALSWSGGLPQRFSPAELQRLVVSPGFTEDATCLRDFSDSNPAPCSFGFPNSTVRIAVIGDSHAWHLLPVLREIAAARKWRVDVFAKSACPPWGPTYVNGTIRRKYTQCTEWARNLPLSENSYDAVLLTVSSAGYRTNPGDAFTAARWKAGLDEIFSRLNAARLPVIWALDTPRFTAFDPMLCAERAILFQSPNLEFCRIGVQYGRDHEIRNIEETSAHAYGAQVVDLSATLCDAKSCNASMNNRPAMRDSNHILPNTALSLRPLLETSLDAAMIDRR